MRLPLTIVAFAVLVALLVLAGRADGATRVGADTRPPPAQKKPEPKKPAPKPVPPKEAPRPVPKRIALGAEADATLTLMDVLGRPQSLRDYRGRTTVIEFWSLAPANAAWDRKLASLIDTYGKQNVAFLIVDVSKADVDPGDAPYKRIVEHAQKNGLAAPILLDKQTVWAERFGATATGEVVVLDPKGIVKYVGAIDDDAQGVKGDLRAAWAANAIDAVLAGRDPSPATTPPSGAPIQFEPRTPVKPSTPPKR
jgi:hypothetical protein